MPASLRRPRWPERRGGRAFLSLLLPALALLLGALALFHAATAGAQDPTAPAAPTNLMATPGNAQLSLTWTAPTGPVTSYDVHYTTGRIVGSVSFPAVANDAPVQTDPMDTASTGWLAVTRNGATASQTISSLENNLYHRVRVRAVNAAGDGAWAFVREAPRNTLVTISASPNPVIEGSHVTVTVTLSKALASEDAIPITITNDTAEPTDHGAPASIYINLAAGSSSASTGIVTNQDDDQEDETFTAALGTFPSSLTDDGWIAVSPSSVTVTITDDDKPTLSLSASPNPVIEGSQVTVTATLSEAVTSDLTIPVTLAAGTAESDDYGTLTSISIAAGATTGTGALSTVADTDGEDETFTVSLGTLPTEVRAGSPSSVTVNIGEAANYTAVTLWAPDTVDEGRPVVVLATLSEAAASDVEIRFTGTLGTAELEDFTVESQALFSAGLTATIPAGGWSAEIEIATEHDNADDGADETFTVALGAMPTGYAGATVPAQVTIDDDERLNPDPDRLTGLTLHDGERELFISANRSGDAVGLGGPDEIYTVQVSPGRRWIDVTLVWTNPDITSVSGSVRYHDSARSDGGTLTWGSSGAKQRLDMHSPLGSSGHPRLTLTVNGATGQPYRIFFQHNFDWKNANDWLAELHMQLRSSQ